MGDQLINRPDYIRRLVSLKDANVFQVLTGVKGSGKSSLLKLMSDYFRNEVGVDEKDIVEIDLESQEMRGIDYRELYRLIKNRYNGSRLHVFIDEIQNVKDWEIAVDALMVDFDCDLYLTASNNAWYFGDYATYVSGRFVSWKVYPLSFREFLDFQGCKVTATRTHDGRYRYSAEDIRGSSVNLEETLSDYMTYGGFPQIARTGSNDQEVKEVLLSEIYGSILCDAASYSAGTESGPVLEKLSQLLTESTGTGISLGHLKEELIVSGLVEVPLEVAKIRDYIDDLLSSYLFYSALKLDVNEEEISIASPKFYPCDPGIQSELAGFSRWDQEVLLESVVFLELKRRGFRVNVGQSKNGEIAFVARKDQHSFYIQVARSLHNPEVLDQKLKPLRKVHKAYKRIVVTGEFFAYNYNIDGIEIVDISEFLLNDLILR